MITVQSLTADVLVVGAGLAGLHTATRLAELGHDVLLAERRADLTAGIRTTGIFVRKTLDDFTLPEEHLGPPIRRAVLYPPSLRRPVELGSDRDEFRVADMPGLYASVASSALAAGVRMRLRTRFVHHEDGVAGLDGPDAPLSVRARFVVGADGARSQVARRLGLDVNRRMLVGAEEVYASTGLAGGPPTFHCVLDPTQAPGYLAWVVDDGEHVHVGVAGYPDRFPRGLTEALARFRRSAPGLPPDLPPEPLERRGGPIPVGGVLRRIGCSAGLLVGDAAGAVSPLTAGGLDPCLRLSDHAVAVLDEARRTGSAEPLRHYDGAVMRSNFRGRIALRSCLSSVRTPALTETGFSLLRTPPGRAIARRILFGDRSFPDVDAPATSAPADPSGCVMETRR
ncbi:FAD-dependent oxidoreductase [Nostocoides sp. F2B08]|uniref:NAD(P)/FAD-dependent oxidoreductase n=1 Tax=Nostocoides sp. F2B08 TaxID=2653936 RepID=UPI001262DE2A|nr:NAD(P)/FAD-dependent oxidoreductase [Tetrasphaera sp. F2B08]KAB7744169.1 FAD-dependent oxidoreductase [Tetrasphaera sp. F2B08]